jgi:hypothetical protein
MLAMHPDLDVVIGVDTHTAAATGATALSWRRHVPKGAPPWIAEVHGNTA